MAKVFQGQGSSATTGHAAQGEAHNDHGSTGLYWLVGIILAIITAIEVLWPALGLGHVGMVGGLMALMILKGAMVVMWFMHLKGDASVFQFVFIAPLTLAVLFVLGFLLLFSGTHNGVAG